MNHYIVGEYIHRNKRDIVAFVTQGPPEGATRIVELNNDTLTEHDVPSGTALEFIRAAAEEPSRGLRSWPTEQARLTATIPTLKSEQRQSARSLLRYWRDMRTHLYDVVYHLNIAPVNSSNGHNLGARNHRRVSSKSH